jgi:hypothetical protein
MTDRTTLTARIIPALAAAALTAACTACTLLQPAPQQQAAGTRPAPSSPAPERTTAAATPGLDRGRAGPGCPVRRRLRHLLL